MSTYDESRAGLRVVKGQLSDEELAALVLVLRARAAARSAARTSTGARGWSDRSRLMLRYTRAGPGAWRATAWVDR